jgi:hypothetical protein
LFYNNVDNPHTPDGFRQVKEYIRTTYDCGIHAAALGPGAASEYPHMFFTIDRGKAQKQIITKCLDRLKNALSILEPEHYLVAGGKAVWWGKFSALEQYAAYPSAPTVRNHIKDLQEQFLEEIWFLEGGGSVILDATTKPFIKQTSPPRPAPTDEEIRALDDLYPYQRSAGSPSDEYIETLIERAMINYKKKLTRFPISKEWIIDINYYESITTNEEANPTFHEKLGSFRLHSSTNAALLENCHHLIVHLEALLLEQLLRDKMNWNMAFSSFMFFERNPPDYLPDAPFSLNFLRI